MLKGLYTAYTGMTNEQNRMDILANNLANAATVGYKKEGATSQSFDALLAYKLKDSSEIAGTKLIGSNNPGVKIGETYVDYTQGSFQITDNTYDLALGGDGFFAVEFTSKSGDVSTKYTRAGSFTLDKDGFLVTKDGDYVLDTNDEYIQLNTLLESSIDSSGRITQNGEEVATIQVVDFEDYNYLSHYGETYFDTIDGAEMKEATATVNSGYLEMSNVQAVQEMVNLISITRAYESNQKVMQTYDDTLDIAVNNLGQLR